jgi:hypothetical protein
MSSLTLDQLPVLVGGIDCTSIIADIDELKARARR